MECLPISVVIPTMNRPSALRRTLDTYMKSSVLPKQIIIVDQSQTDEMVESVKKIIKAYSEMVEIRYVFQEIPSLTKARNKGLSLASENIIVLSDDDIDIYPDTLLNLYSIMQDDTISLVAGFDDNGERSKSCIGYLLGTKSFRKRKIGHVTNSMLGRYPDKVVGQIKTEWAMGFFFAIKKQYTDQWNLKWDENLTSYAYAEDLDFSYSYYKNSKKNKLRCVLDERIHVRHLVSKEYRVPSKKHMYMYVINRLYLSYKHSMGIKSILSMKWCNFILYIYKIVKKENPQDMRSAMKVAARNKKAITEGKLCDLYTK
jgi:glycosyltransferase involved in cell wall biosynthesis